MDDTTLTSSGKGSYLEQCTCMSVGWVYAGCFVDKENFAVFDSSMYVTVADLQSAISMIQDKFLQNPRTN